MKTKDLTKIALFVAVLTVSAYITVPFVIPFTMQTFAVFLACFMLGGVKAFVAILVYVLLGAIGLPVFSGFKGGAGALLGPTGGYIIGFLVSALVYGAITAVFGEKKFVKFTAAVVGLALLYAFGSLWFAFGYSTGGAGSLGVILIKCVVPYIVPDLVKIFAAAIVAERLNKVLTHA